MKGYESFKHTTWECKYHVVGSFQSVGGRCCMGS